MSTGLRINRASDDAAGLGVSENLRTQIRGTAQATKNAQDGIALLNIAEGAANEISDILQRMRELAIQTSNDTLTSTERNYADLEFQKLDDEINRIAKVTNYNGVGLISSESNRFGVGHSTNTDVGSVLWIDANNTVGTDSVTVSISTLTSSGLNIDTLALSSQTGSTQAISRLDNAIDSVNSMRANLGAYVNRLDHAINNLLSSNSNQQAAESLIRDVDFAAESTKFTRNQILTQSGTAMLSQANMLPQSVLQLVG